MLSAISNISKSKTSSSFTLVELLVVLAIIAVLAAVIVLVINPAELLKQFRDASRINDLASINRALNYVLTDCPTCFFGTSSIVYVSIPDSSPTCANLGLPSLPSGWSYACSDSNNYRKVDGTGWIPVDFTKFSAGSPLSKLPVDPINTTSTGQYYTYVTGGSWELTTLLESNKNQEKAINDGDAFPGVYSLRTSPNPLTPGLRDKGMVGYWSFDEGSGTTAYDRSGNNNNGTLINGPTWTQGKVSSALSFDGTSNYVLVTNPSNNALNPSYITISAWFKTSFTSTNWRKIIGKGPDSSEVYSIYISPSNYPYPNYCHVERQIGSQASFNSTGPTVTDGNWHNCVYTFDGSVEKIYVDGVLRNTQNTSGTLTGNNENVSIGAEKSSTTSMYYFDGLIDEVRIYNRALSDAEIKAIYDATK
jgi:prepilin-type N-terminal cleavage/methylation domain-containing protein